MKKNEIFLALSKNQLKKISFLKTKKGRKEESKFVAEGLRLVKEGIESNYKCEMIIATPEFVNKHPGFTDLLNILTENVRVTDVKSFGKITDTKNPQGIAAVFCSQPLYSQTEFSGNKIVALENISDPGNLGTVLRNCAWFGVEEVLLSENSAEIYNPKVLRASMGAVFHLNISVSKKFYDELKIFRNNGYSIVYTDLKGESIFKFNAPEKMIIGFSNEANGPSEELKNISDKVITIPRLGRIESLNVASASAVILAELTKD